MREEGYQVEELCEAFELSKSGYYAARNRPLSDRAKENEAIVSKIKAIHEEICYEPNIVRPPFGAINTAKSVSRLFRFLPKIPRFFFFTILPFAFILLDSKIWLKIFIPNTLPGNNTEY